MMEKLLIIVGLAVISPLAWANNAKIVALNGKVLVNNSRVSVGARLNEKDLIRVEGKDKYIDIEFSNGDHMRLVNGAIFFKKFKKGSTVVHLLKGKLLNAVKKKKVSGLFTVNTRRASFTVKRPKKKKKESLFLVTENNRQTYLYVEKGRVVSSNLTFTSTFHEVKEGKNLVVFTNVETKPPAPTPTEKLIVNKQLFTRLRAPAADNSVYFDSSEI